MIKEQRDNSITLSNGIHNTNSKIKIYAVEKINFERLMALSPNDH